METSKDDPFSTDFVLPPRVPHGLAAVVESLTREVLRKKPDDIYVFAAHYFERLLTLRKEHNEKRGTSKEYNFYKKLRKRSGICELKECRIARSSRDSTRNSGWALNETAKVLETYRIVLEDRDRGRKSEVVQNLTTEKKNTKSSSSSQTKRENRNTKSLGVSQECFRRAEENNGNSKTLKIIPQMPSALNPSGTDKKDIKMELRKNRLSLRERSSDSSNEYQQKSERVEVEEKSEEEQRERRILHSNRSIQRNGAHRRRKSSSSSTVESATAKKELTEVQNIEQVKEYVARIFNATKSTEESDSAYVERVQEVIDRTAPMIREKLEELKVDVLQRSKKPLEQKQNSTESDSTNEENVDTEKSKKHENTSNETLKTENKKNEKCRDTLEARLIDMQHTLEEISSSYHAKAQLNEQRPKSSNGRLHRIENNSESIAETDSKISLPAVRPASSRSCRSLSRNELDNLTLPPISLETCKILKKKDNTTLPSLSQVTTDVQSSPSSIQVGETENNQSNLGEEISRLSTSIKDDVATTKQVLENVNDALRDTVISSSPNLKSEQSEIIDIRDETQVEEVFKDSLNVTPDLIDVPQRPDSLESQERPSTTESHLTNANSQLTGLEYKLKEIEAIEKNVEKAFDTLAKVDSHIQDGNQTFSINESMVNLDSTKVEATSPAIKEFENIKEGTEVSDSKKAEQNQEPTIMKTKEKLGNEENITVKSAIKDVPTYQKTEKLKSTISENPKSRKNLVENLQSISENLDNPSNNKKAQEDGSSDSSNKEKEITYPIHLPLSSPSKELPCSYILTEGSPVEIPEFVTTVIIPDRKESPPEIEFIDLIMEEDKEIPEKRCPMEAFGEFIRPEPIECSTVGIDFIQGIKASHEIAIAKQHLDGIKEEEEIEEDPKEFSLIKETLSTENEQKTDKIVVSKLEDISEKEEIEEIQAKESIVIEETEEKNSVEERENCANVAENSLDGEESTETGATSTESTNEVKETTISDRSGDSVFLDPARSVVPELNLDSLRDLTVSSFKMNDEDEASSLSDPAISDFTEQNLKIREKEKKEDNFNRQEEKMKSNEKLKKDICEKNEEGDAKVLSSDQKFPESKTLESDDKNEEKEITGEFRSNLLKYSQVQEESRDKDEHKDTNKDEATDLETAEEITKELIESDRAKTTARIREEEKIEIPDISKKHEKSDISEENVVAENDKQDDKDVICLPNTSGIVASPIDSEIDGTVNTNKESSQKVKKEEVEIEYEAEVLEGDTEEKKETEESEEVKIEKKETSHDEKKEEEEVVVVEEKEAEEEEEEEKEKDEDKNLKSEEAIIQAGKLYHEEKNTENEETQEEHTQESVVNEKAEENEDVKEITLSTSETNRTTNSNITTDTAATKIQAGVRGFLTRRRLDKENRRGSTLDSVPSIKDISMNEETVTSTTSKEEKEKDEKEKEEEEEKEEKEEEEEKEEGKEDAPTITKTATVKKAPKIILSETTIAEDSQKISELLVVTVPAISRLRCENALERKTLSAENAFAPNGLQHPGEFHDCLPLPLFDITDKALSIYPLTSQEQKEQDIAKQPDKPEEKSNEIEEKEPIHESTDSFPDSNENSAEESIEIISPSSSTSFAKGLATFFGQLHPEGLQDIAKLLITQTKPVVVGLVDVASPLSNMNEQGVKDESNLQNRYLNFITSVEDAESNLMKNPNLTINAANYAADTKSSYDISDTQSSQSIREPLALPGTPQGVIIEEITSLDSLTTSKMQNVFKETVSLDSTHEITEKMTTDSLNPLELLEEQNQEEDDKPTAVNKLSKTSSTNPSTLPRGRSDIQEDLINEKMTSNIEYGKEENKIDDKFEKESHESSISDIDNANETLEAETKEMNNKNLDGKSDPEVSVKKKL